MRKSLGDESYTIRFTPRKPGSVWSAINIRRVQELSEQGLMRPAGLAAFEKRKENKSGIYAYENRPADLPAEYDAQFKANAKAWAFFHAKPAGYRRTAVWWIVSAKQEATRLRRLATLIDDSANGRTLAHLTRPGK